MGSTQPFEIIESDRIAGMVAYRDRLRRDLRGIIEFGNCCLRGDGVPAELVRFVKEQIVFLKTLDTAIAKANGESS